MRNKYSKENKEKMRMKKEQSKHFVLQIQDGTIGQKINTIKENK